MEPYTAVDHTPIIAEKPFIAADTESPGRFNLVVPPVSTNATRGVDWAVHHSHLVSPDKTVPPVSATNTHAQTRSRLHVMKP
jgi:hypothetical protein